MLPAFLLPARRSRWLPRAARCMRSPTRMERIVTTTQLAVPVVVRVRGSELQTRLSVNAPKAAARRHRLKSATATGRIWVRPPRRSSSACGWRSVRCTIPPVVICSFPDLADGRAELGRPILYRAEMGSSGWILVVRRYAHQWLGSAHEIKGGCVLPSKATAREPITRPDTYQRLPTAPPHLRRAVGPYIWGTSPRSRRVG